MNTIILQTHLFTVKYLRNELAKVDPKEQVTIKFVQEAHCFVQDETEGTPLIYETIYNLCYEQNRSPSTITYITGNVFEAEAHDEYVRIYNVTDCITAIYEHFWIHTVRNIHQDLYYINTCRKNILRPKYYTFLNKVERPNKNYILNQFAESGLIDEDKGIHTAHWQLGPIHNLLDENYNIHRTLLKKLPLTLGEHDPNRTHVPDLNSQYIKAHEDTYFDVVVETLAGYPLSNSTSQPVPTWWKEMFFSEKTWRCLFYGRPFLLFGHQGALAKLKEWGFKTFDQFWDESYDDMLSLKDRAITITAITKKIISEYSLQQMHDLYYSQPMQEILQHNRDRILELTHTEKELFISQDIARSIAVEIDNPDAPLIVLQKDHLNTPNYLGTAMLEYYNKIMRTQKVIIDFSFESVSVLTIDESAGLNRDTLIYDYIEESATFAGIPLYFIHYISGNQFELENYNNYTLEMGKKRPFINVHGRHTQIPATYYCEDLSYTSNNRDTHKPKYALTMHRRPAMHRIELLDQMYSMNVIDDTKLISKFNWDWDKHVSINPNASIGLKGMLPKNTPEDDQICYSEDYPQYYKQMFADTYYSIESETQADLYLESAGAILKELYPWWQRMYFTEKIWRNMYWKRPFLLIGDRHMLKELHRLGFRTWHNILWDESYDDEPDWRKRITLMLEQHKYIVDNFSLEELHRKIWSKEVQDILEHNRYRFIELAKRHK